MFCFSSYRLPKELKSRWFTRKHWRAVCRPSHPFLCLVCTYPQSHLRHRRRQFPRAIVRSGVIDGPENRPITRSRTSPITVVRWLTKPATTKIFGWTITTSAPSNRNRHLARCHSRLRTIFQQKTSPRRARRPPPTWRLRKRTFWNRLPLPVLCPQSVCRTCQLTVAWRVDIASDHCSLETEQIFRR